MYEFNGLFTKIDVEGFNLNPSRFQTKNLRPNYPFFCIRFKPILDAYDDDTVDLEVMSLNLVDEGVTDSLVLSYSTFGGQLEYLCGFEIRNSKVVESSRFRLEFNTYEDDLMIIFVEKMQSYGIGIQASGYFEIFERDYFES